MKICELMDNWDRVRKDTITKYPHICCALLNRDIEIDGDAVILRYAPNESVIGKIAAEFKDSIKDGISQFIDDEFRLVITKTEKER